MSDDWPDTQADAVARALNAAGHDSSATTDRFILRGEVLRLRAQIAALTAEHSGACDDMAQCTRCWEREQIEEAAHSRTRLEALETAGDQLMAAARSLAYTWETDSTDKQMWEAWKRFGPAKDAWLTVRLAAGPAERRAADELARVSRDLGLYDRTDGEPT